MTQGIKLTARFEEVEPGCIQGALLELPGVITEASTVDEAKEMLVDALREYLLALQSVPASGDQDAGIKSQLEILIRAA